VLKEEAVTGGLRIVLFVKQEIRAKVKETANRGIAKGSFARACFKTFFAGHFLVRGLAADFKSRFERGRSSLKKFPSHIPLSTAP
jgi:hypothetical protein